MPIDLNYMLRLARRWWWLLVLAPVISGMTAFYVSDRQPNMYSADATLFLTAGVSAPNVGNVQASRNLLETYTQWAVSRPVLERAANTLGYDNGASALSGDVFSYTVPDTLYIQVTAHATDPDEAALIADAVANEFILDVAEKTQIQNEQIKSQVVDQIAGTTETFNELNSQIRELETQQPMLTNAESAQLQELRRQRTDRTNELNRLQTTLREIEVELTTVSTRITVSSPAVPPSAPYAPVTTRAAMIGGIMGLVLAAAATAVLQYLDNTVRSREDLARVANAPVLAAITSAQSLKRGGSGLFVLDEPNSASAEAMRLLRANVEFASAPDRLTSLAITSPGPAEGKSTITANLGVAMAHAGLKTVIIDADLRRPAQHKIFGVDNKQGLSTLLATPNPDWRHAAMALSIHNLVLVPSGPVPPNPSDLLSLDRFNYILSDLGTWADVILIDSTPILSASDALVVATKANGTLMICRAGQTRNDAVRRATATLHHARARLIGTVLNLTPPNDIDHYGQYEDMSSDNSPSASNYYFGRQDRDTSLSKLIVTANGSTNGKHLPAGHSDRDVRTVRGK